MYSKVLKGAAFTPVAGALLPQLGSGYGSAIMSVFGIMLVLVVFSTLFAKKN